MNNNNYKWNLTNTFPTVPDDADFVAVLLSDGNIVCSGLFLPLTGFFVPDSTTCERPKYWGDLPMPPQNEIMDNKGTP